MSKLSWRYCPTCNDTGKVEGPGFSFASVQLYVCPTCQGRPEETRISRFERAKFALVNFVASTNMDHEIRKRCCWKIYHIRLMQVWMWNGSYRSNDKKRTRLGMRSPQEASGEVRLQAGARPEDQKEGRACVRETAQDDCGKDWTTLRRDLTGD